MPSKLVCAAAAVWTAAAYRVDRKSIAAAVSESRANSANVEVEGAIAGLSSEIEVAMVAAGLARFHGIHGLGDKPLAAFDEYEDLQKLMPTNISADSDPSTLDSPAMRKTMKSMFDGINQWHKKFSSVPASDPMWTQVRKRIKEQMMAISKDATEWIEYVEKKDWVGYNKKSCAFFGGAGLIPEPGKSTVRPTDAFYCGHPAVDWSGGQFGGKPINDLCHAKVGDASKPNLCGKYTDKEIVLGLAVGADEISADSRNVNVMTVDCLMDIVDGDIYYCQKCAGRCNG